MTAPIKAVSQNITMPLETLQTKAGASDTMLDRFCTAPGGTVTHELPYFVKITIQETTTANVATKYCRYVVRWLSTLKHAPTPA
mmetsp:Transcript_35590/g.101297  ORF Transcript_35590/g.101297 Transcript_35590/m.101297 type:complete len:84 (-) Transcript_35590:276-527(-)